jgi:hypothetical protein
MKDPHWVDYVGALGGFAGVVLASVAAWFARASGREAQRTADAAERTAVAAEEESKVSRELVEIQRSEHAAFLEDRARAPALNVTCGVHMDFHVGEPPWRRVILEIGWTNTGTKALAGAGFNLVVPTDVTMWRAQGSGAVQAVPGRWLMPAPLHELNEGLPSHYMTRLVDAPLHQPTVMHIGLDISVAGRYPLELKIFHHELPGGGTRSILVLDVRDDRPTTLHRIEPGALPVARQAKP